MTYLQLVNKVLLRLREAQVTSISDTTYSQLIGEFVNLAKEEVEDSWNWSALRTNISVTTLTDGTNTYALPGTNERSKIMYGWNTTHVFPMIFAPYSYIQEVVILNLGSQGAPYYFNSAGVDSSNQLKIEVYPLPNSADTLTFTCKVPQATLSADNDVLTVPSRPVIERAYALAIEERGEDGGTSALSQNKKAELALGDAILHDQSIHQDELNWLVD